MEKAAYPRVKQLNGFLLQYFAIRKAKTCLIKHYKILIKSFRRIFFIRTPVRKESEQLLTIKNIG